MEQDKWLLTVSFDTLAVQEERDPELTFPNDEVSQTIPAIAKFLDCLPEELDECCEWSDTFVKVTFDTLQNIDKLLNFITMHTIPRTLVLTREG